MTEIQFKSIAAEAGYSDDEIQDFIDFHNETDIPFDDIPLMEHIKN